MLFPQRKSKNIQELIQEKQLLKESCKVVGEVYKGSKDIISIYSTSFETF